MKKVSKLYGFTKIYRDLKELVKDDKLASFGDSYVNFVYSLALSNRKGEPTGAKVAGAMLAQAFRKAGLRVYMPSRVSRHMLADAAEALIAYAWLHGEVTLEESVVIVGKSSDSIEGFTQLLMTIRNRLKFS